MSKYRIGSLFSGYGGLDLGVPGITRTEAIKACGNGVVPQQAAHALQKMTETEATK